MLVLFMQDLWQWKFQLQQVEPPVVRYNSNIFYCLIFGVQLLLPFVLLPFQHTPVHSVLYPLHDLVFGPVPLFSQIKN